MLCGKGTAGANQPLLPLQQAAATGGDHQTGCMFRQRAQDPVENILAQIRVGQMEKTTLTAALRWQGKGWQAVHLSEQLARFLACQTGPKAQMAGVMIEKRLLGLGGL